MATAKRIQREFERLLQENERQVLDSMRDRKSGKIILNSDDLFKSYPPYDADVGRRFQLGSILYPVAKVFTDAVFKKLLRSKVTPDADTVVFTAGGSAVGKSSILRKAGKKRGVAFILDTTLRDSKRAFQQIEAALKAGFKVEVHYLYRDFRASVVGMIQRGLDPSSGRIVPIDDMAATHFGAQRTILEVLQHYSDDPRVSITLTQNTKGGKLLRMDELEFARRLFSSVDQLQQIGQNVLDELQDSQRSKRPKAGAHHHAGRKDLRISKAFYEAARSKAQKRNVRARKSDA